MGYVAGVDLTVNEEVRKKGQPVPEAESWPSLGQLVNGGLLIEVDDQPKPKPKSKAKPTTTKKE